MDDLHSTIYAGVFAATSTLANPSKELVRYFQGVIESENKSGQPVTERSAVGLPALKYALSRIAGDVAQLPLWPYERQGAAKGPIEHQEWAAAKLLNEQASEWQTAFTFRESVMLAAMLYGNGVALLDAENGGARSAMLLDPCRTFPVLVIDEQQRTRRKFFVVHRTDGREADVYSDEQCLHIYRFSLDGVSGLGLLTIAKTAIGEGLGGQYHASASYRNGARPSLLLSAPVGAFRDEATAKDFLKNFNETHAGSANAGKAGLLINGITAAPVVMTAEDMQFIEQRKFSRQEIMLLTGMESLPGDGDSVSYNSLEQKNRAYLSHTLGPWLRVWEQECFAKLLTVQQQRSGKVYWQFDAWQFTRPDANQEAVMLQSYVGARILSPNESREVLGYPPYDGGDEFANPAIDKKDAAKPAEAAEPNEPAKQMEAAIRATLERLAAIEAKRIAAATGTPNKFLDWLDRFYGSWGATIDRALESLGIHFEGEKWASDSKAMLLEASGHSTAETLTLACGDAFDVALHDRIEHVITRDEACRKS